MCPPDYYLPLAIAAEQAKHGCVRLEVLARHHDALLLEMMGWSKPQLLRAFGLVVIITLQ